MLDAIHLPDNVNFTPNQGSGPSFEKGKPFPELKNARSLNPHIERLNALKKLRLLRLKQAFAASNILEKFSEKKTKTKPLLSQRPDIEEKNNSDPNILILETERINNLPILSPHVFEVLLKTLLQFQKQKPDKKDLQLSDFLNGLDNQNNQNLDQKKRTPSFEDRLKLTM